MGIENYETLQYCSIVLNPTGLGWQGFVLSADFGGGYEAAAVTVPYGLKRWTLQANVLPDNDDYLISYPLNTNTVTSTRMRYFFEFFQRHILFGNKPFIIRDADTNKKFLVSFVQTNVDLDRLGYQLFAGQVQVKERRAGDLQFNSDGSIIAPGSPTVTSFTANELSDTVIRLAMAADDADAVTGVDLEFSLTGLNQQAAPGTGGWTNLLDDVAPLATYDHDDLTGNTHYYYRFRARDEDENVSAWAFADDTTDATPDLTDPTMTYFDAQAQPVITEIRVFFAATDNQTVSVNLKYDLQWSLNGTSGWTNLLTKQTYTSPYIHSSRTPNTEYFYRMRVWDEADNFSDWSTDSATTLIDDVVPVIDNFNATGGNQQISISAEFHDNIGVTGVDLQWAIDAVGSTGWTYLLNNASPTTTTTLEYTHQPLPDATTRFYRLRVRDAQGNTTAFSSDSATTNTGGVGGGEASWADGSNMTWLDGTPIDYA